MSSSNSPSTSKPGVTPLLSISFSYLRHPMPRQREDVVWRRARPVVDLDSPVCDEPPVQALLLKTRRRETTLQSVSTLFSFRENKVPFCVCEPLPYLEPVSVHDAKRRTAG